MPSEVGYLFNCCSSLLHNGLVLSKCRGTCVYVVSEGVVSDADKCCYPAVKTVNY